MAEDPTTGLYPSRWESDVVLADGGTMSVRPIRPDDAELILRFHERQSPESIYFRFFSPRPRLSQRDLDRFTHVDYSDRMAFVGLIGDELVGVARYDRHRGRSDAEVAFFIDDAHHGRGMATVLLEYLAAAAREAGISGFTASVLPQNRRMLGVFTQAGFTASSHFEDGVIEVDLGIEPTPEALAAIEARAATAESRSVERILRPTSIAVVGASRDPGSIGNQVLRQLLHHRFNGPVYPVNREASHVASVRAWSSVVDLPGEVDLAVICVPLGEVRRVVEECAVKRVQALVVLTAGFAEHDEAGERLEEDLVAYARRHGMRLLGPNTLGLINTDPDVRMHATFVPVSVIPGRTALAAQSGVIGAAIVDACRQRGLGISSFVAVGNKADVSSNDLLRYWQDDGGTDVVMVYLESFGNPQKFGRTVRALSQHKPVVAVKVDGVPATGWDEPDAWPPGATATALLEQTGVIRVDNLTQMIHTSTLLASQPLPGGNRVAVLTNSWGPAWLAVDALHAAGLDAAAPIAMDNDSVPDDYERELRALYRSGRVDAVLVVYAPASDPRYAEFGAGLVAAAGEPGALTTLACFLGEHDPDVLVGDNGVRIPDFPFPEEAAAALGRVCRYSAWRAQPAGALFDLGDDAFAPVRSNVRAWLAAGEQRRWLGPVEVEQLLAGAGLAIVDQRLVDNADEAVTAARELGYPVAVKASGLARLSRSEAGGVALDVHGDDEVRDAFRRMTDALGEAMRPAVVQTMVAGGVECRVGMYRHEVLGDVMTLGPGGAAVEHIAERALQILPLTDADADRLIDRSVMAEVVQAQGPRARAALVDLLVRVAALADAVPEITRLRLNPVVVGDGRAAITDCRVLLQPHVADQRPPVRRLETGDQP
ncbi:MAG: GNAT family N-acetyltransferase [Microthrixaceae bacterium]|nr:GNAT family N-acetyltransferase [Acidimicrobiales bacterium]MCB9404158.1 GNAT family N-acetyltransferase [Microthrixaceae bacterium]